MGLPGGRYTSNANLPRGGPRTGHSREGSLQAAAVCYRRVGESVEFLLVMTSGGKWTFPKGCISGDGGARQSALREALEEAGAVGDIAEQPFCRYLHAKGTFWRGGLREFLVEAYLMEVLFTVATDESLRNPSWLLAPAAKQKLAVGREQKYGCELQNVIDQALLLIERSRKSANRKAG